MYQDILFEEVYPLDLICHFAKQKNNNELVKLLALGFSINHKINGCSSVMLLAKQGDDESVKFLINEFGADKNDAVLGAARGGHEELTKYLLTCGAHIEDAVWGAARGGHLTLTNYLLSCNNTCQTEAMWAAGLGGHTSLINNLAASYREVVYVVKGSYINGFLKPDKIMRFLSQIDSPDLRQKFLNETKKTSIEITATLRRVDNIRFLMKEYDLSFDQAVSLKRGFLPLIYLVKDLELRNGNIFLPKEILFIILSCVINQSYDVTKEIVLKIMKQHQKKLDCLKLKTTNSQNYHNTFFRNISCKFSNYFETKIKKMLDQNKASRNNKQGFRFI